MKFRHRHLTTPVILIYEKIPQLTRYHLCNFNIGENSDTSTSTSLLFYCRRQGWQAPKRPHFSDMAENARMDTLPSLLFSYVRNQIALSPQMYFYADNYF